MTFEDVLRANGFEERPADSARATRLDGERGTLWQEKDGQAQASISHAPLGTMPDLMTVSLWIPETETVVHVGRWWDPEKARRELPVKLPESYAGITA